jgi:RNA polymerase sigma factor (TIGR02999 family)
MDTPQDSSVTQLLEAAGQGNSSANEQLKRILVEELPRLKSQQINYEAAGAMQAKSLVHEAFIRLTDGQPLQFANRLHFFCAASSAMRQICVDEARRHNLLNQGGDNRRDNLTLEQPAVSDDPSELLAIHELLERFASVDARKAKIVEYRYFAGMSIDETAEIMQTSPRTVENEWQFAKAWMHREFSRSRGLSR